MLRMTVRWVPFILLSVRGVALAAGSDMPWEGPLQQILDSITGPVVRIGAVIAIVALGLTMAISEMGTVARRAVSAVFGLSIAMAAASWGLSFFGFTGGASF